MSPYEIGILLHYYARVEDHTDMERDPPVWRPTIEMFKSALLLAENPCPTPRMAYVLTERGRAYVDALTERGRAYVDALKRVPLPIQIWVIPGEQVQS